MKKLLMGTAFLTVIGLAITASQFSCTKGSAQTTTTGLTQLNLVLFHKKVYTGSSSSYSSTYETWLMNNDGTNQRKVIFSVPGAARYGDAKLTPDGKKIIFTAMFTAPDPTYSIYKIYSCDIDGSNNKLLVTGNFTDKYNYEAFELSDTY